MSSISFLQSNCKSPEPSSMQFSQSSSLMAPPTSPLNPKQDQNHETGKIREPQATRGRYHDRGTVLPIPSTIGLDGFTIKHVEKVNQVRAIVRNLKDPSEQMVMIDNLQRLGINYHFQEEIESFLRSLYGKGNASSSIYEVALRFRLLREHGYHVSPDVFNSFKDKEGRFKPHLSTDIKGMTCLFEASKLAIKGEDILHEAEDFARMSLIASMESMEPGREKLASHALEHPFHMSLARFNTKHHLESLQGTDRITEALKDLAKLDFNIVQSMHQNELNEVIKWWRDLGLSQKLRFARDQPLKWYMWSLTALPNPRLSKYRIELTKPIALVYIIDDIFDIYGTLDELIQFTAAINRWDPADVDQLPPCMKICFMVLHDITNDIASMVFKEHGWNPINFLRKTWKDLCNAFLAEAKWFSRGDLPKADEYLRNGVVSSGVPTVMMHIFFFTLGHVNTGSDIVLEDNIPKLLTCPGMILRLWDDLGSAKDENQDGHDGSYLECYMKENGDCSLESAKRHVKHLISNAWKELNEECLVSRKSYSPSFVEASLNTARMVQIMYSYDKDRRLPVLEQQFTSLLKESISL